MQLSRNGQTKNARIKEFITNIQSKADNQDALIEQISKKEISIQDLKDKHLINIIIDAGKNKLLGHLLEQEQTHDEGLLVETIEMPFLPLFFAMGRKIYDAANLILESWGNSELFRIAKEEFKYKFYESEYGEYFLDNLVMNCLKSNLPNIMTQSQPNEMEAILKIFKNSITVMKLYGIRYTRDIHDDCVLKMIADNKDTYLEKMLSLKLFANYSFNFKVDIRAFPWPDPTCLVWMIQIKKDPLLFTILFELYLNGTITILDRDLADAISLDIKKQSDIFRRAIAKLDKPLQEKLYSRLCNFQDTKLAHDDIEGIFPSAYCKFTETFHSEQMHSGFGFFDIKDTQIQVREYENKLSSVEKTSFSKVKFSDTEEDNGYDDAFAFD